MLSVLNWIAYSLLFKVFGWNFKNVYLFVWIAWKELHNLPKGVVQMLGTATGGWRDMLKTGQAWEPIQNHNPGSPNFHKTLLYKLKHPLQQKFRINRARILFSDFPQLKKITAATIWFHNMVKFPLWSRRYLGTFWWNNLHQAVHVMVLFPAGSHSMKINAYTFLHKKYLYICLDIYTYNPFIEKKK